MSSLAWLAIPLVALAFAILWAVWVSRSRPRADTHDSLEERARFKSVFDRHRRD